MRWLEANSHSYQPSNSPYVDRTNVFAAGAIAGPRVLLWGDDDLEWMDANEATLARTVGTVSLACAVRAQAASLITLPVVRMGLLVSEDIEDQSAPPFIDLWERESVEEHEWMWLNQFGRWEWVGTQGTTFVAGTADQWANYRVDVDIDSRIKRKLGKKDALLLYCQWGLPATDGSEPSYDVVVTYHHLIRTLMMTK